MIATDDIFDALRQAKDQNGSLAAANLLVEHLRIQKRYRDLFEALKMQQRLLLGLPAVPSESEEAIGGDLQDKLERGLIDACREVGLGLLAQGKLEEGWMFFRPVGDRHAAAKALEGIEPSGEQIDLLLQILVHEAVDVARGTRLSLEHRGTCNTITMMESVVAMRGRPEQQLAVAELVRHVHAELLSAMQQDWQRRQGTAADPQLGLPQLLASLPGWLQDGTYHLDTTHLASTVRFARVLDDPATLTLARDLATYGKQLHPQYHYPSEEPFADLYAASLTFFDALLGHQTEASLKYFLQKAESLDPQEHGTVGIETYVDLLDRTGRHAEALRFLVRKMPPSARPFGIAPSLLELSRKAGDFRTMIEQSQERKDLIGFAAALLQSPSNPT
jgi:hypothetical protein